MKRHAVRRGISAFLLILFLIVFLAFSVFTVGFIVSDANVKIYHPTVEKAEIEPILRKESLTSEDYALLYRQTGVSAIGIDRARTHGESGIRRILLIQSAYFSQKKIKHDNFAPLMCTDFVTGNDIPHIYLEDGDILVTASTHFSAFRMGHAGIVTNGIREDILQAEAYGANSCIGEPGDFTDHASFLILRPKADSDTVAAVVDYAKKNLVGIPYNAFAGIFTNKESIQSTQCAHLIWYAFHLFGVELTDPGKSLILPFDLANSDALEVVQVYGFDPDTLWDALFY